MNDSDVAGSIVVGIDGSQAAIRAAEWGLVEAVSRHVALRLVHVIQSTANDVSRETEEGEAALRAARAVIEATGHDVEVHTALVRGPIAAMLETESQHAEMVCVGSVGNAPAVRKLLGSNAAAVAQSAHCPVAIIRTSGGTPQSASGCIAVVVDDPANDDPANDDSTNVDSTNVDEVLRVAIAEAQLREAAVLALSLRPSELSEIGDTTVDDRLVEWQLKYPGVHTETAEVRTGLAEFLAEREPPVTLVIVSSTNGNAVAALVGTFGRLVLHHTHCSVLVIPQRDPKLDPKVNGHIVTLTMNPALDLSTAVEVVVTTDKMRCGPGRYDPGGGGINVARVARVLGAPVSAIFPAGGVTGGLLTDLVREVGVPVRVVKIVEPTRESLTVNEGTSGRQYRFVLPGPQLTTTEQVECLDQLRLAAASADFVVASGSLPPGLHPNFYQQVADICRSNGARLILDTSGTGLRHITSGVFLLKPSVRELREFVGRPLETESDQLAAARELIDRGCAEVVVVSLGEDGALLVTADSSQRYGSVPVPLGSGVGAGDSMVAAITVGLSRGWPLEEAVRLGVAAGAAMLLTPGSAPCTRPDVERLFALVAKPVDLGLAVALNT